MLCRLWQQGCCTYGEQCRYLHSGAGTSTQGSGREVCRHHLRGTCRFGETCRYAHVGEAGGKKGQAGRGKGAGWDRSGAGQGCGKGGGPFGVGKGPGADVRSLTGPYLGRGSELAKVWWMPDTQGHDDGIFTAIMMGDRVCTGGKDGRLMVWMGQRSNTGSNTLVEDNEVDFGSGVTSLLFHAESKWLFCGLFNGDIRAFRQEPAAETRLTGHREPVTCMLVHESVLVSGSHDGSVRAWQYDTAGNSFQCVATIASPLGQVFKILVHPSGNLWVGSQRGITCVNLQSLQPVGNVESPSRVVAMLLYQSSIIVAFANGTIKVYDATGNEQFSHGPLGEHTTNTSVAMMRIPNKGKDVLLCGQELGYVTAYDIPDFKPRGSFSTGYDGEVMTILDLGADGLFVTCGFSGDVVIWRWEEDKAMGVMSTSPF